MKSVITAICLLIPLVIIFVIIDRKDFYSGDDVVQEQTVTEMKPTTVTMLMPVEQPAETKPVKVKPAETRPVTETKPAETKLVVETKTTETKPAETKPVSETKPGEITPTVETKSAIAAKPVAETKLADVKPVTETKPAETKPVETMAVSEEKPAPVAIPVVTAEEAEKLNAEAVLFLEEHKKIKNRLGKLLICENFAFSRTVDSKNTLVETNNWKLEKDSVEEDDSNILSEIRNQIFSVKTKKQIKYNLIHPLYSYKKYQYNIVCKIRGVGLVVAGFNNQEKEFNIQTQSYTIIATDFQDADLYFTESIKPFIKMQGDLQFESISIYRKVLFEDNVFCKGTISEITKVPLPEQANYPDCLYTAHFIVKEIIDGYPVPEDIQLLIPAFRNYTPSDLSKTLTKGNWSLSIRPFEKASKIEQEIEQVDEIESYEYTPFLVNAANPLKTGYLDISGIPILKGSSYSSPYDFPVNPPVSEEYLSDSKRKIDEQLLIVNKIVNQFDHNSTNDKQAEINAINKDFQDTWNDVQNKYDSYNDSIVWANINNSFFALPKKWSFIHPGLISDENLKAISELNIFLRKQGILFIIQVIPSYRDIAALVLNPSFQKYGDYQSALVVKQLLEHDIETHYLSEDFIHNAFLYERLFAYPNDHHSDDGAQEILTSHLSKRLLSLNNLYSKDLNQELFETRMVEEDYNPQNNKWPSNCNIGNHTPGDLYQVPMFFYDGKRITPNKESKILVIGNSFIQKPLDNHGYIQYLAKKMLHVPDSLRQNGIGPLVFIPRMFLLKTNDILHDKKIVVLPISISFLSDNYSFSNILSLDNIFRIQSSSEHIYHFSADQLCTQVFPSSCSFDISWGDWFLSHPNLFCLKNDNIISIQIPPLSSRVHNLSLDVSVSLKYSAKNVNLVINGQSIPTPSCYNPEYHIIHLDFQDKPDTITIMLDEKSQHNDTEVFIGSIDIYSSK